jgi:hypothetical protein
MRVSIQVDDNIIVIDGKVMNVDLQALRGRNISAVQWYGELGEVEFKGHKQANQTIRSIKEFQEFMKRAKPPPDPTAPTPDELDAQHRAYLERNPDARRAWDERDAAMKRDAEARAALAAQGQQALEDHTTSAKPLPAPEQRPPLQPGAPERPPLGALPFTGLPEPPQPTETDTKPKTKPKKK